MFCWPSRRGSSSRKKSKSSDLSFTGGGGDDDKSITGGSVGGNSGVGGGILVKPYKQKKKGGKNATFKCDLSEALLPPSDECLINSRSASCNSSIRELNGYRGNSNKQFVSSQIIPTVEENSDSVNNNNNNKTGTGGVGVSNNYRSAEVLLFYSNNSLSTRNSVQDFIDNEDFNYKSLWGKDINEWDSRESRCNTLERDNNKREKSGTPKNTTSKSSEVSKSQKEKRLSAAASSPSLSISLSNPKNRGDDIKSKYFDEPLPSPPPTPPEAKICLDNLSLGTCAYFKYPQATRDQKSAQSQTTENKTPSPKSSPPPPCRINSSTSTSSLSSSCILTPEVNERPIILSEEDNISDDNKLSKWSTTATQTLPFWQLEFPGILHCTSCLTSQSSHDSGILVNGGGGGEGGDSSTTPLLILATSRGHESPGGDSSSGISSSDDNLESLHADEEIMLKSLKNSFLHQAIPFQLCNLSINSSNNVGKDKLNQGRVGGGGGGSATVITSTITNVYKESVQNEQQECHLPQQLENELECIHQEHDDIPSVTNEEGWLLVIVMINHYLTIV